MLFKKLDDTSFRISFALNIHLESSMLLFLLFSQATFDNFHERCFNNIKVSVNLPCFHGRSYDFVGFCIPFQHVLKRQDLLSILFYIRKSKDETSGNASVYLRITYNEQRTETSTLRRGATELDTFYSELIGIILYYMIKN